MLVGIAWRRVALFKLETCYHVKRTSKMSSAKNINASVVNLGQNSCNPCFAQSYQLAKFRLQSQYYNRLLLK